MELHFGFLDSEEAITCNNFKISPDYRFNRNDIKGITEDGWCIAPSIKSRRFTAPYNYIIECNFISTEHIRYLVWCFSFFKGVRLGTENSEFIDALCIKTNSLGFITLNNDLTTALQIVYDNYKLNHRLYPERIASIINLIFLSYNKFYERREQYTYLYIALDVCFAILRDQGKFKQIPKDSKKPTAIVDLYNIKQPLDLDKIISYRNNIFHEGLISGKPLGYEPVKENLLIFRNFICKILFCLMNINCNEYIREVPCETLDMFPIHII